MTELKKNIISINQLRLDQERVLLAGGAGFIGHHLALELAEKGAKVMIADHLQVNNIIKILTDLNLDEQRRQLYTNFTLDRFKLLRNKNINIINVDVRNMIDFNKIHNDFGPTKIVHLAAISSAVIANKTPSLAYDIQISSLRNLIELSRLKGSKVNQIVFMSSSTIYGDFEEDEVTETMRPKPKGVYANGKYMGERMVREAYSLYDIPYTIIRPSALYGIRCVSGRVSQKFIEHALMKKPLQLEGGGKGLLDFTDVRDVVKGIILSMGLDNGISRTFNITYGNAQPISKLVDIIKQHIPDVIVQDAPAAMEKPKRGTLRIDRAKEFLGFEPDYSIEKGYNDFVKWYIKEWEKIN